MYDLNLVLRAVEKELSTLNQGRFNITVQAPQVRETETTGVIAVYYTQETGMSHMVMPDSVIHIIFKQTKDIPLTFQFMYGLSIHPSPTYASTTEAIHYTTEDPKQLNKDNVVNKIITQFLLTYRNFCEDNYRHFKQVADNFFNEILRADEEMKENNNGL